MPFSDFHGNERTVGCLREMLAQGRLPQAVILSGPEGSGKYTLALMLARAMNCLNRRSSDHLPDFCGQCSNCVRIGETADLEARLLEAMEAREALREADRKETRILIQTHPDVLVIPPDPPQMMIKIDQVRQVIEGIYFRPSEARERVYIFTDSAFMKEAANALLKILEEPPEFTTIFLLSENSGELLPTIRSRSMIFTLGSVPRAVVESYLAEQRPHWSHEQRSLVARLSGGRLGRALRFNLDSYTAARRHALTLLNAAVQGGEHSELFKLTESYRPGGEGRARTEELLRTLYSLLEDLMFLRSGAPDLLRNSDMEGQLRKLAELVDFQWISAAAERLADVERGMRRNLIRSLSLDALVLELDRSAQP